MCRSYERNILGIYLHPGNIGADMSHYAAFEELEMLSPAYTTYSIDDGIGFCVNDVLPILPHDVIISFVILSYMSSWLDHTLDK
jgi:hypothetical protein